MSVELEEREQINNLLIQTDEYIRHEYLSVLDQATLKTINNDMVNHNCAAMQIMHLHSFVYGSDDDITQKISSLYGSIEQTGNTAALILDGRNDRIDLYLGVVNNSSDGINTGFKSFVSSFNGVFPGCRYTNVKQKNCNDLMNEWFNPPVKTSIAAVSAFPLQADKTGHKAIQGLESIIDGMRNRPFTMLLLAESINRIELVQMRQGLESLFTQISPLQKQDVSVSSSKTESLGINFSKSIADSLSVSSGISKGYSDTSGISHSTQINPDNEPQKKMQAVNQLIGTAAAATSVLTMGEGGIVLKQGANILQSLFYGQTLSNLLGGVETVSGKEPPLDRKSITDGSHEDHTDTYTETETKTEGYTITRGEGSSESWGMTTGQTTQISYSNKSIEGLLERIDNQIHEIMKLESEGAYRVAAYFVAGDEETASLAASLYRSIVTAGMECQVNSPVYLWSGNRGKQILDILRMGRHPTFAFEKHPQFPLVTTAQPIGLSDLSYYLCLPRKSVYGIDVAEHASFSRDILLRDYSRKQPVRTVTIGNIYHLGKEAKTSSVTVDIDILSSHLFVAGATGCGKSNFCYHLLNELLQKNVKTLIIEPAKGEYAKVLGGRPDFKVFGTNLKQAPPLRINPFAFPYGVSSSEHIERLLAIFNAAWPMYSAMPAIMKEALEEIYHNRGFDDVIGDLPEGSSFPTFADLLKVLPKVIKRSEYSAEVQGNYIGALVTRVKSLTNGVYSIIFSDDEVGDEILFDENVIVDISRIGSEETKSLIMGILVMRLSEYRSCSGLMNSELKHITLLEEAHHLLGRTGTAHNQDTGNMMGASVQMLCNAIREMRTYGDGFIIADQSPSVMDPSVIANTQTKVFFMMPGREDRDIASNAMSLNEEQAREIAKFPKGVAVLFQNEWSAAVLCKIAHFKSEQHNPYQYSCDPVNEAKELLTSAIRFVNDCSMLKCVTDCKGVTEIISQGTFCEKGYGLGRKRKLVIDILENRSKYVGLSSTELMNIYDSLLDLNTILINNSETASITSWTEEIEKQLQFKTFLEKDEVETILRIYLLAKSKGDKEFRKLYVDYLSLKYEN